MKNKSALASIIGLVAMSAIKRSHSSGSLARKSWINHAIQVTSEYKSMRELLSETSFTEANEYINDPYFELTYTPLMPEELLDSSNIFSTISDFKKGKNSFGSLREFQHLTLKHSRKSTRYNVGDVVVNESLMLTGKLDTIYDDALKNKSSIKALYIDTDEYLRAESNLLSDFNNLELLFIDAEDISEEIMKMVGKLSNLKALYLRSYGTIDIEPLKHLKNLKILHIRSRRCKAVTGSYHNSHTIYDVNPLEYIPTNNLIGLYLDSGRINLSHEAVFKNFFNPNRCTSLKFLVLGGCESNERYGRITGTEENKLNSRIDLSKIPSLQSFHLISDWATRGVEFEEGWSNFEATRIFVKPVPKLVAIKIGTRIGTDISFHPGPEGAENIIAAPKLKVLINKYQKGFKRGLASNLQHTPKLELLNCAFDPIIGNVSEIESLKKLKQLKLLSNRPGSSGIEFSKYSFTKIQYITTIDFEYVKFLKGIKKLKHLRRIDTTGIGSSFRNTQLSLPNDITSCPALRNIQTYKVLDIGSMVAMRKWEKLNTNNRLMIFESSSERMSDKPIGDSLSDLLDLNCSINLNGTIQNGFGYILSSIDGILGANLFFGSPYIGWAKVHTRLTSNEIKKIARSSKKIKGIMPEVREYSDEGSVSLTFLSISGVQNFNMLQEKCFDSSPEYGGKIINNIPPYRHERFGTIESNPQVINLTLRLYDLDLRLARNRSEVLKMLNLVQSDSSPRGSISLNIQYARSIELEYFLQALNDVTGFKVPALSLKGPGKIDGVPMESGSIGSLIESLYASLTPSKLSLSGITNIIRLPKSIMNGDIEYISLSRLDNLIELGKDEDFTRMENLKQLNLLNLPSLRFLPESIFKLPSILNRKGKFGIKIERCQNIEINRKMADFAFRISEKNYLLAREIIQLYKKRQNRNNIRRY